MRLAMYLKERLVNVETKSYVRVDSTSHLACDAGDVAVAVDPWMDVKQMTRSRFPIRVRAGVVNALRILFSPTHQSMTSAK